MRSLPGWHHRDHAAFERGKPCQLRSFLAVYSESPLPTSNPGRRWIGNITPQTIGKSFSIPWHNSRWRLGAAGRRDGGETAGKCGILFLFPKTFEPSSEGSVAKLARVHKRPFAVAEDQREAASLDSLFPSRARFPQNLSCRSFAIGGQAAESLGAPSFSNQDCAFAKAPLAWYGDVPLSGLPD